MFRFLYSFLLMAVTPLILLRLLWRGFRQLGYWQHLGERFGHYHGPALKGTIWVHAVSVGEMRATKPLVTQLRAAFPGRPIFLTCMTPTGRTTAAELYAAGSGVSFAYLPYDFAWLHGRLIEHIQPSVLLVMETEIWPNLFAAARARGVPAWLINARLSQRSFDGYARLAPVRALIFEALQGMAGVAAQTDADAKRLESLGARPVQVTGNVKFDASVDAALMERGNGWRTALGGQRRVLLAASTRDGEETLLLDAYCKQFSAERRGNVLLVLVPRHPQRFEAVAQLVIGAGLRMQRRSSNDQPQAATEVWLGDSMGEMAAYIAMCDVAFVGGSLLPLGGQNLIEACVQGKPVLMGPSVFNFNEAARLAVEAGAMRQADSAVEIMQVADHLLENDAERKAMSDAARKFAQAHAGATLRLFNLISRELRRQD
jgi:3-deoxy-D-manno-octulosonic-acid transferase